MPTATTKTKAQKPTSTLRKTRKKKELAQVSAPLSREDFILEEGGPYAENAKQIAELARRASRRIQRREHRKAHRRARNERYYQNRKESTPRGRKRPIHPPALPAYTGSLATLAR